MSRSFKKYAIIIVAALVGVFFSAQILAQFPIISKLKFWE